MKEQTQTTTHISYSHDIPTGDIIFIGRICQSDLVKLKLDRLDKMVLNSPIEGAADVLQSLEIMCRRIEEQNV